MKTTLGDYKYKELFKIYESMESVLVEGQNEERAKKQLSKAGKIDAYEQLLSITEPYKNDPNGKNNKHLPKLVDFYLENQPIIEEEI